MCTVRDIIPLIERLVGEKCTCSDENSLSLTIFKDHNGIGYSQFNEVLLLLGYDRIENYFFQFLVSGENKYVLGSTFKSIDDLKEGIDRFSKLALLWYGSLRYAFNILSEDEEELDLKIHANRPYDVREYKDRHHQINSINKIPADKTFLLGYIVKDKYEKILEDDPENIKARIYLEERRRFVEFGKRNQTSYLSSDHLDVYVATSMRLEHEYLFVSKLVEEIFNQRNLKSLNLRYFDPTQAYCESRIDKGLSEALMLKRAKCTLYLVQESDTLGKDSELASTLAQGKPVIAYVPDVNHNFLDSLLDDLKSINSETILQEIILNQLQIFDPSLAWGKNKDLIGWLENPSDAPIQELKKLLLTAVKNKYDTRARTLKDTHPLGIQVNLRSGVANGVLVVRNIKDCANLIESIVLNKMEFQISEELKDQTNGTYISLVENISKSIFRIKTGDEILTNAFWNFYLNDN